MRNKKKFIFNMNVLIVLLCFISLANSISFEEREAIFRENDCKVDECDVFEIELSSRRKRSLDSTISFPLRAFGREKMINLRQSDGILVGYNTPVYITESTASDPKMKKRYGLFDSKMRSQLYEDKANLAAFTLDTDSDVPKIKSGFIVSDNLLISELSNDRMEKFANGSRKQTYLARSILNDIYNGISDMLGIGVVSYHPRPDIPIPDVIYPEVLVLVDFKIYNRFNRNLEEIIPYLYQFWSGVDMFFRQLQNPMYRLSIAGVVIPEDVFVFNFLRPSESWFSSGNLIDYNSALKDMGEWLKRAQDSIPFNSYDVHITMSPYLDGIIYHTGTIGMAHVGSACSAKNYGAPKGGIIAEPRSHEGILRTAHELGHIFGSEHDDGYSCEQKYIMAPRESSSATKWSECSIRDFHNALQTMDFSCMYNKPELGNFDDSNLINSVESKIPKNPHPTKTDGNPKTFHVVLTSDNKRLVVSKQEFAIDRFIKIYYENNNLIITQVNTGKPSVSLEEKPSPLDRNSFLQIVVPDNNIIEINCNEINPSNTVNIYHEKNLIYVYQGNKPVFEKKVNNYVPESKPKEKEKKELSPYFSENENSEMCFDKTDFIRGKLVKIYYDNNKIHVSQRNVPDDMYPYELKSSYLQYIGSDLEYVYLHSTKINWDKEVCVRHDDNSILIYQGEKPHLDKPAIISGEIKYLPEDSESYVYKKLPEPDIEKSVPIFDLTLDSGDTISLYSNEFNEKKLVSISFENNKLNITQVGTPDEKKIEGNKMLSEDENLTFMASDDNKLLLHPARVTSKKVIHIRHEDKTIKIWQGSPDGPSLVPSTNSPDIVDIVITDFNASINSGETLEIFSDEFNPDKYVSVAFEDNKLKITQYKIIRKINVYYPRSHKNLQIIHPDLFILDLNPTKVHPHNEIRMRHENGKIYIWQGSITLPKVHVPMPEVFQAHRPNY